MFTPTKPKLRFTLTFEGSWPTSVAFLDHARHLAAGNQLGHILVWELPEKPPEFKADPKSERQAPNVWPKRQLVGHTNEIAQLVSTPDGSTLASASFDRTVRLWPTKGSVDGQAELILDEETRKREARRTGKKEPAKSPGISVETQSQSEVLKYHKDWIYSLGISGDGKRLISGDAACQVAVWDIATRKTVATWAGHPWNWIISASLNTDGTLALASEYRYKRDDFDVPTPGLKLWDVAAGKEKLDFLKVQFPKINPADRGYGPSQMWRKFVGNGLIASAISPDGKLVAVGQGGETDTGKIHLLDTKTGKLVRDVASHMYGVTDVLFTSDGKHVISAGRDTCVRVCQVTDGKEVAVLGTPRGGQFKDWLSAIALSPDERWLAAADIAGMVHVWEFEV